jgi:serine kinase of HPr protein (carbohydrate metabolism regulator)
MNATENIHATCVRVARAGKMFDAPPGAGVLLMGASGAGKSDLALRLIGRGALLVADDRTELYVERGRLMARAPKTLSGLVEVRGLGIIEIVKAGPTPVTLVVNLSASVKRMPRHRSFVPPKPLMLPRQARPMSISVCAFEASAPDKVLAAVAALHNDAFRDSVKRN